MRSSLLLFIVSLFCACSQSITVTQPPPTPTSRIATDTIDFGSSPLWREADTTMTLKLKSNAAITTSVSDSNFTVLSASVGSDSMLTISVRYQPRTVEYHSGSVLVLTKTDTVSRIEVNAKASVFERRVGDSYIFQTNSREMDSVVVIAIPLKLQSSLRTHISSELESVTLDTNNDWIMYGVGKALAAIRLPIVSEFLTCLSPVVLQGPLDPIPPPVQRILQPILPLASIAIISIAKCLTPSQTSARTIDQVII
jgi:hypothetical protein